MNGPAALPDVEVNKLMSYVVSNLTRSVSHSFTVDKLYPLVRYSICLSPGFMVKFIRPLTYPTLAEQGAPLT